jgi:hypothetical protein
LDWLIVVVGSLMPFALFAAMAVTSNTKIEPLNIPAVIVAGTATILMTLLTVARKRRTPVSRLSVFLPPGLVLAILLPLQLLQVRELGEFSRVLTVLLICNGVFNVVVVQQLCAWAGNWRRSRPRLQRQHLRAKPKEDFGNNIP